jgi:hypothetical protein
MNDKTKHICHNYRHPDKRRAMWKATLRPVTHVWYLLDTDDGNVFQAFGSTRSSQLVVNLAGAENDPLDALSSNKLGFVVDHSAEHRAFVKQDTIPNNQTD